MSLSLSSWAKLLDRDNGQCIHCGENEAISPHHRKNRGMGGSKMLQSSSNLLVVCSWLNGMMESDSGIAEMAKSRGWRVLSWQDPLQVPVWDSHNGSWYLLDDQHGRQETNGL